jgi:MoxR-like ATPase
VDREVAIVQARLPDVPERLARQAAAFVAELRELELAKAPGVAETLDWVQALASLQERDLEEEVVDSTLGAVLKYHEDIERARAHGLAGLVAAAKRADAG